MVLRVPRLGWVSYSVQSEVNLCGASGRITVKQCVPLYSHRPYFPFGSCLGNRISHAFEGATATPDIPLLVTPISCIRVGFTYVTRLTQYLQVLNIKFSFWVL